MNTSLRIMSGDRGEAVRDLQQRLASLGIDVSADEPGDFGPATEAGLRRFQAQRRLRDDGVCAAQTWSALVESGYRLGDRLLCDRGARRMMRGDDVATLQRCLNSLGFDAGRDDGIFGPGTATALREFQRNAGLTVDGICGPATVAAIERLGRPEEGSVALVRERETLLRAPRELVGRRVFLAVDQALEALGDSIARALTDAGAGVLGERGTDDQSGLAERANKLEADLVVIVALGPDPVPACAFYEAGQFRSERGFLLARCILEELAAVLGEEPGEPSGRSYPVLRETRAPAVVCEAASPNDVATVRRLVENLGSAGRAIARGVRRAVEEPPEPEAE